MIHSIHEQQSKSTSDSCRKTYAFSSVTVMESDFFGSVFLKIFLYLIFHWSFFSENIFFIFPVSYLFSYYILSFLSVVVLLQIPRYNDSRIHMIFRKGESWHEKRKRSHPSVFKKNIRIKSIRQRIWPWKARLPFSESICWTVWMFLSPPLLSCQRKRFISR